jgi:adhesin HecA-like repeat protein
LDLSEAMTRSLDLHSCYVCDLNLKGTQINGGLSLNGAHLTNPNGYALAADGMTVTGSMLCQDGFQAEGGIRLTGARIGGSLGLSGAHLTNPDGCALTADGMTVTGGIFCRDGFQAEGEIRLTGANIGGQFTLNGAHLTNPDGYALSADDMTVTYDMFCRDGFQAKGGIRLLGARIGGSLDLNGARLTNPDGYALAADRMTVTGGMSCRDGFQAKGGIRLLGARIGALLDDPASWPSRLVLDGLAYGDLRAYLPARRRLVWLGRMGGYRAQPYEELAAYYRRLGHDEQARRVLLAKFRARTKERPWWARFWGWFQDVLAGYGYAPGRAVAWLTGVFIGGWAYFGFHHPAPAKPQDHPVFHAALYALDLMLPAPSLDQEQSWDPQGTVLGVATTLRIFGWLLAIAVVASMTRALSRN